MIKILHTADLHVDSSSTFFAKQQEAVRQIIENSSMADLLIIAGDLAGLNPRHTWTVAERLTLARAVIKAAINIPIVVVRGNHDMPHEVSILRMLALQNEIVVADTEPVTTTITTAHGPVFVAALPHMQQKTSDKDKITEYLKDSLKRAPRGMPRIAVLHQGVYNATPFLQYETDELEIDDEIGEIGYDYVALGHIHEHVIFSNGHSCYPGVPYPLRLGDSNKGYVVTTVEHNSMPKIEFVRMKTWEIIEQRVEKLDDIDPAKYTGTHLRVVITRNAATISPARIAELKEEAARAGVLSVSIRTTMQPAQETPRIPDVAELDDTTLLARILTEKNVPEEQTKRIINKFKELASNAT